jgi:hypothetical protein
MSGEGVDPTTFIGGWIPNKQEGEGGLYQSGRAGKAWEPPLRTLVSQTLRIT